MKSIKLLLFFLLISICSFGQTSLEDKLKIIAQSLEKTPKADTIRYQKLDDAAWELRHIAPTEAMAYARKALELAEILTYLRGIGTSLNMMGVLYENLSDYDRALEFYKKALDKRIKLNDEIAIANTLGNIGIVYQKQGEYNKSIEYQLEALNIREGIGHKQGVSNSLNEIGVVYKKQSHFEDALVYYQKALNLSEELNDSSSIAMSYNNIGSVYYAQQDFNKAFEYYLKSLKIRELKGNKRALISSYNNIGNVLLKARRYEDALKYYLRGLRLSEDLGDRSQVAIINNGLGNLLVEMKSYTRAINYYKRSLKISQEIGALAIEVQNYQELASIYEILAQQSTAEDRRVYVEIAYDYYKKKSALRDTIFDQERVKEIAESQAKYEIEKHARENERLRTEHILKENTIKRQTILITGAGIIAILMGFLLVVVFRNYKTKQKINDLLTEKNAELQSTQEEIKVINENLLTANDVIQKKNNDITASINYAKRIQTAMFPSIDMLENGLDDFFVLLKPRDIVSGDFYWFTDEGNKLVLTAADCTGHGVPGAFMSMIGFEQLTEIVNLNSVTSASEILTQLDKGVSTILKQDEGSNSDGMDMALCVIDKDKKRVEFAGAKNPLIYIQENEEGEKEVFTIKGDKNPIGGGQRYRSGKSYSNHVVSCKKNTSFYIFSDGFQDQFGGGNNRKFMIKNLKKLFFDIHHLPMNEQKEILEQRFDEWKGEHDQIDDVLVMGFRV